MNRNLERAQSSKAWRIIYLAYNIRKEQRFQLFLLAKSIQSENYLEEQTYLELSTTIINYGEQIEPQRERWSDDYFNGRKL